MARRHDTIGTTARKAVYAAGIATTLLLAAAAAGLVARDYGVAVQNAELHLDNFAIVLAEHTRLALAGADADLRATISGKAATSAPPVRVRDFFTEAYRGLELAYKGRIIVFREDGTLITYVPWQGELPTTQFGAHALFSDAARSRDSGAVRAQGVVDGGDRVVAYRRITGYPLLVAVSAPMSEVLEYWRRDTALVLLGALVLGSVLGAATLLLARQLRTTEQLAREAADSEQRLESIIGSAMDAVITIDDAQRVVIFNTAAERTFGCHAGEAIGSEVERFIPQRYRAAHRGHVTHFGEAGVTMRRMGGNLVLTGLRANGEEFPIDASISHVTVSGRKFYTVILRDVTARQQAAEAIDRSHRELRELYESMHQVREAERTRIARELHDELAQWLTALKMDAAWIGARLPAGEQQLARKVDGMKKVVDSTVTAVRRIAADLRPVMLDDLGVVPALEGLVNDLSQRAGIEVTLAAGEEFELREPLATALYRMVQEALTNVARHANATSASVELRVEGRGLHVCVRDNGRGFNPDAAHKSYGVLGIRERARTLGGEARIYSPPEGGTVVEIDLPMEAKRAEGAAT